MKMNKPEQTPDFSPTTVAQSSRARTVGNPPAAGQLDAFLGVGGAAQLEQEDFDFSAAVGGWRGFAEATVPAVAFIIAYTLTSSSWYSLGAALAMVAVIVVARLLMRQSVRYALTGIVGIAISAAWVLYSGQARDFFAWGLLVNAFWTICILVTLLVNKPLVSWALAVGTHLPANWWNQSEHAILARGARQLTWMWLGLFLLRVVTQTPLWLTDQVVALGVVRLILGVPAVAIAAWITWRVLHPFFSSSAASTAP